MCDNICKDVQLRLNEMKAAYKKWQGGPQRNAQGQEKSSTEGIVTFLGTLQLFEVPERRPPRWEEWSNNLNIAEGKIKMFKIKQMRKDKREVEGKMIQVK